jgi:hypothetical protein
MYELIERLLPLGQEDWMDLAPAFNRRMVGTNRPERDWESIRQKHRWLRNTSKPTGDPDCRPEIKRAKDAQRAIEQRACTLEENEDPSELGEDNDNGEEVEEEENLFYEDDNDGGNEGGAGVAEDADGEFEEILQCRHLLNRTSSGQQSEGSKDSIMPDTLNRFEGECMLGTGASDSASGCASGSASGKSTTSGSNFHFNAPNEQSKTIVTDAPESSSFIVICS